MDEKQERCGNKSLVEGTGTIEEIKILKSENARLNKLAQQDALTGLLNRRAIETQVDEMLKHYDSGVFLMMDVDEFKYINDKYGHLAGDRTLMELANIMKQCFFKKDLLGRMGGDEFAVFLPGAHNENMVESKVEHLNDRFAQMGRRLGIGGQIRITVGAEFLREGDSFHTLYERADTAMRFGKSDWRKSLHFYKPDMKACGTDSGSRRVHPAASSDINYIGCQIRESNPVKGAYCQDYNTFIAIYRFLERGLERTGLRVHMILLSLTDQCGTFVALDDREFLIEKLRESLCGSLRASDIYTQYSSCQFLAMLPGAARENMSVVTARIQNSFRIRVPDREDLVLSFSFYPLQPTAAGFHPSELKNG